MYNVEAKNELSLIQDGEKGQRIVVYQPETMSIQTFEWSHVLHGFIYTDDEKHEWQDAEVKLYIDDIEIELDTKKVTAPKFRDPSTMTYEQLHDPDYHIKQLAKLNGGKLDITCSKCHHCR